MLLINTGISMSMEKSKDILERLANGEVIIGDGSYVNTLEKRGYVLVMINQISISSEAAL